MGQGIIQAFFGSYLGCTDWTLNPVDSLIILRAAVNKHALLRWTESLPTLSSWQTLCTITGSRTHFGDKAQCLHPLGKTALLKGQPAISFVCMARANGNASAVSSTRAGSRVAEDWEEKCTPFYPVSRDENTIALQLIKARLCSMPPYLCF